MANVGILALAIVEIVESNENIVNRYFISIKAMVSEERQLLKAKVEKNSIAFFLLVTLMFSRVPFTRRTIERKFWLQLFETDRKIL